LTRDHSSASENGLKEFFTGYYKVFPCQSCILVKEAHGSLQSKQQ
jgi:hypothetical protein